MSASSEDGDVTMSANVSSSSSSCLSSSFSSPSSSSASSNSASASSPRSTTSSTLSTALSLCPTTIKIFNAGEDNEVLELFAPKRVCDIFNLGLFPGAFGLRARSEGGQGTGPTYVLEEEVPNGNYVLAVRATSDGAAEARKVQLAHFDSFKHKRPAPDDGEDTEDKDDKDDKDDKEDKEDKDETEVASTSNNSGNGGANGGGGGPGTCEFCPTPIEGRRVICSSKECQDSYRRSRAKMYRARKRAKETHSAEEQSDEEATDDESPKKKAVVSQPVNLQSPFWRLVPERLHIPPTPITWDRLGIGHPNPEKGMWHRAAYVYGAHMPNVWHERTNLLRVLDRDTTEDARVMRSSFIPRANNLRDTKYFPALDRAQEPAPNTLLLMKGEGRGKCGYFFMVWNPSKSYGCPMTLLLSKPCPFPDSCPTLKT